MNRSNNKSDSIVSRQDSVIRPIKKGAMNI